MRILLISVLLFLPLGARASPINPAPFRRVLDPAEKIQVFLHPCGKTAGYSERCWIKIAGVLQEFVLRENIRDCEAISRIGEEMEAVKRDLRLLRSDSYDWFWKPKFLQTTIRGFEFETGSEGPTPVIRMKF